MSLGRRVLTVGQYVVAFGALLSVPYIIVGIASLFKETSKKEHERLAQYDLLGTCKENHATVGAEYTGHWTLYREISSGRHWDFGSALRRDKSIDIASIRDHAYEPPYTLTLDRLTQGKLSEGASLTFAATSEHSAIASDGSETELPGYASTCEMQVTNVALGEPTQPVNP